MNKILFLLLLSPALQSMEHASDAAMIAVLMTPTAPVQQVETPSDTKKKYQCYWPGCSKSFITSSHLKEHNRTHTGEKPYTCKYPDCGKSFAQSAHLTGHARTHTREKPYVCEYPDCDKRFARSYHLTEHERIHTGEKPYVCEICSKRFTTSTPLKRHLRTQHPASPDVMLASINEHTSPILGKRAFEPLQETQNDSEKQQHLLDMQSGGEISFYDLALFTSSYQAAITNTDSIEKREILNYE